MPTDLEIAHSVTPRPIVDVAADLGLTPDDLEMYGAGQGENQSADFGTAAGGKPGGPRGKLIVVTAITPTPAGEGKTTVTIGLAEGLNTLGKKAIAAIREPSLGPVIRGQGRRGGRRLRAGAADGGHQPALHR